MATDRWFLEFEAEIDSDWRIALPEGLRHDLPQHVGPVQVRLSGLTGIRELGARGVSGEEISDLARYQATGEAEICRTLLAEGSLRQSAFAERAKRLGEGGEP
jgi:hypothetical protein